MKKIAYYISIIVLFGVTACNDILDQMPHNSIAGGNMWTTEAQADLGVIGVYSSIQNPVQGGQLIGQSLSIGNYAFEAFGMAGQGSYGINNLFTTGVNPSNGRFDFTWKWCYDGVHRANAAIFYIPEISMPDTKKARLIAECKVLRAFFYSRLNELFGNGGIGVPLYLEPTAPEEFTKGQSSEAEIWNQIIADLTDAINEPNLKNNDIQGEGRTSKGLAYALRGKAYLITKEYDKAAADFSKVSECGYGLHPDYKELFKESQERCKEMIFSIQYIASPNYGSRIQKFCGPFQAGSKDGRGCWTDVQISPAVVDLYEVIENGNTVKPFRWEDFFPEWNSLSVEDRKVFFIRNKNFEGAEIHSTITTVIDTQLATLSEQAKELYLENDNESRLAEVYTNRDPRMNHNIIVPYSKFLGVNSNSSAEVEYIYRWPVKGKAYGDQVSADNNLCEGMIPTLSPNAQARFLYLFRKFIGEGLEYALREANPVDEPILRYADVLLMWAEALVENGDLSGAMEKVKLVRDRVGIPTPASSFSNQSTARNYVRDERRREFVGEGINFFDEMRWRTLKETKFDTLYPRLVWGGQTGGTTYQWIGDQWYTWPVPKKEIEMNKNLKPTPGWVY
jgi:SusD family.